MTTSFGKRKRRERRSSPRCDVSREAAVYFGDPTTRIGGLVRNISLTGAYFVVDRPVDLPQQVVLQFCNGDEFDCEVVRDVNSTEFGLRFVEAEEFRQSDTRTCVASVENFTQRQTPRELYLLLDEMGFFGDDEIEETLHTMVTSFDRFVRLCNERILARSS